jgi:NADH-quinone oxidoreductase subunit M
MNFNNVNNLFILFIIPVIFAFLYAIICSIWKNIGVKKLAFIVSIIIAVIAVYSVFNFNTKLNGVSKTWITQIGLTLNFQLADGFAALMVIMTAILTICIVGFSNSNRTWKYFVLILILEANAFGLFLSGDVLLFYLLFEFMIIPFFLLIGMYGKNSKAAMKYLLYSFFGGVIMLFGIIVMYKYVDSFAFVDVAKGVKFMPENIRHFVYITIFIGLAIKAPIVPLHSWLPTTAKNAPIEISAFLISIMDKMGTFGMIYILLNLFPDTSRWISPIVVVFALISIIYGAFLAIAQDNLLKMVAFSSISHFGFIVLGIYSMSQTALLGAKLYMLAHGLSICLILLILKALEKRTKTLQISKLGGLQKVYPWFSCVFLIAGMAIIALPGTLTFPSELMVVVGAFNIHKWWGIIAGFGMIIGTLYILLAYQNGFTGKTYKGLTIKKPVLTNKYMALEKVIPFVLIALIIFFGFFSNFLINYINTIFI